MQTVRGCRLSVMEAFRRISCNTLLALVVLFALEIWTLPSLLSFSPSGVWVLLVEYVVFVFSGTRALLGSTVDTHVSRGLGRFFHIFHVAVKLVS